MAEVLIKVRKMAIFPMAWGFTHQATPKPLAIWTTGYTDTQEYLPASRMKIDKSKPSPISVFQSRTLSSIRLQARILSVRDISTLNDRFSVKGILLLSRSWTG